jgi:hypothetical protein
MNSYKCLPNKEVTVEAGKQVAVDDLLIQIEVAGQDV